MAEGAGIFLLSVEESLRLGEAKVRILAVEDPSAVYLILDPEVGEDFVELLGGTESTLSIFETMNREVMEKTWDKEKISFMYFQ